MIGCRTWCEIFFEDLFRLDQKLVSNLKSLMQRRDSIGQLTALRNHGRKKGIRGLIFTECAIRSVSFLFILFFMLP